MPDFKLPVPEVGSTDKQTIQNLLDVILKYRKELTFLLQHLDDSNIGKITANVIDTSTLIVGDNIAMGPNAVIAWGQIDGGPNTTYIDANGIYTGNLSANQINAGKISALYIDTDISQVNSSLYLGESYESYSSIVFTGQSSISASGDVMTLSSVGGIGFDSYTSFNSYVDFTNATVQGFDYAPDNPYIESYGGYGYSISCTEFGIIVRDGATILGQIAYDV